MSKSDEKKASKKAAKAESVGHVEQVVDETPKKEKKEKKDKKEKKEKKEKKNKTDETETAEPAVVAEKSPKEKKEKKNKAEKTEKSSAKPKATKPAAAAASPAFSLTSGKSAFDPTISSLFANSFGPSKSDSSAPTTARAESKNRKVEVDDEEDDEELSEIDVDSADEDLEIEPESEEDAIPTAPVAVDDADKKRKRKRKEDNDDLEGVYMDRLAREEEKEVAKLKEERLSNKRQKMAEAGEPTSDAEAQDEDDEDGDDNDEEDEDEDMEDAGTPPPVHESLLPEVDTELAKSQRTVFLANVSIAAITSKTAEKTLRTHLSAFFSELDAPSKDQPPHKIESIRFRSTAFASAIPKKAAFAKKELMEATTRSTNAYVVYSSPQLSREAARRLNGTVVLDRHIRVDEVAHPAKVDHKRCIFVGNLGFVDDESNIDQANEEEGMGKRNGRKVPSDIEEGLWRTFATCGTVESVRVVRDSKTRVGKGFAYVQFTDENAVEAALLLNEKKFPPMLPRKLRISRAKAIKRNAKPGQSVAKPPTHTKAKGAGGVYNPKMSGQEASQLGRAGKLLGRAAAAQLRTGDVKGRDGSNIRAPESFIFEGHRASSKGGKTGLKLGGKKGGGSKGKPGGRSAKRGAAWKSSGGKN